MGFFENTNIQLDFRKECGDTLFRISELYYKTELGTYWDWMMRNSKVCLGSVSLGGYKNWILRTINNGNYIEFCVIENERITDIFEIKKVLLINLKDYAYDVTKDYYNMFSDSNIEKLFNSLLKYEAWANGGYKKSFNYKIYKLDCWITNCINKNVNRIREREIKKRVNGILN